MNEPIFDKLLSSRGMVYFQNELDMLKLKGEFTQLHLHFANYELVKNFRKILGFFELVAKCDYNYELFLPNMLKLLKLVMIHPATTASCERSFRLNNLIKSDIRSTMSHERFNHLRVMKHYKEILKELNLEDLMREFTSRNDRRKNHFSRIARVNMKSII